MSGQRRAIIVGHTGQDGTFLYRDLYRRGFEVLGFGRSSLRSTNNQQLSIRPDIANPESIYRLVREVQPTDIYYLAAHHTSSEQVDNAALQTAFIQAQQTHVVGLLHFLCAIRELRPSCKLFYASSSLVFNGADSEIQNEETPLTPHGFYAITKAEGMWLCREFREHFGLFVSVGILYNHESHLRSHMFLSQKIIQSAIRIASGTQETLVIGDLSARVDWSYAPDFVRAFQRIVDLDESQDFIVASGEAHSVEEFVRLAFGALGLDADQHVVEDPSILNRKASLRIGDISRLRSRTGWKSSLSFQGLVEQLITDAQASAQEGPSVEHT